MLLQIGHQTVKSYLSAVRHLQISQGLGDPNMGSMPKLEYVVRGLKKEQAGQPKRNRLPITPAILRKIRQKWEAPTVQNGITLCYGQLCVSVFSAS